MSEEHGERGEHSHHHAHHRHACANLSLQNSSNKTALKDLMGH